MNEFNVCMNIELQHFFFFKFLRILKGIQKQTAVEWNYDKKKKEKQNFNNKKTLALVKFLPLKIHKHNIRQHCLLLLSLDSNYFIIDKIFNVLPCPSVKDWRFLANTQETVILAWHLL